MKIGFTPDTHLNEVSDIRPELTRLAEGFAEAGVTDVIHLGDIVDENHITTTQIYDNILDGLESVFSQFNLHYTIGNHDSEVLSAQQFEQMRQTKLNQCIFETDSTAVLLINTGTQVELSETNTELSCGAIAQAGIELIESYLHKDELYIATHYPLQYTPIFQTQTFFDIHPEYTFPVNKLALEKRLREYEKLPDITVFCGHLHPRNNMTVVTKPFDITVNARRPIKQFDEEDYEMSPYIDHASHYITEI